MSDDARAYATAEAKLYQAIARRRLSRARNGAIALVAAALLANAALIVLLDRDGGWSWRSIVGPALGGLIVTAIVLGIAFLLVRYGAAKLGALSRRPGGESRAGGRGAAAMSADDIRLARQEAERARRRLAATTTELQQRLKPGTLASHAWAGVKDKSGDLAEDAVEAVKARPVIVSAALAAFTLFLARSPIKAAVGRLIDGDGEERNAEIARPKRARKEGASV